MQNNHLTYVRDNNDIHEVTLSGILSEFRIALQEEIEESKRNAANSSVPLKDGKKIAQIGNAYQYLFEIENVLNLPGDTSGDLYVPGRNPIEVCIISIEGLSITLSVPENLGNFVPIANVN